MICKLEPTLPRTSYAQAPLVLRTTSQADPDQGEGPTSPSAPTILDMKTLPIILALLGALGASSAYADSSAVADYEEAVQRAAGEALPAQATSAGWLFCAPGLCSTPQDSASKTADPGTSSHLVQLREGGATYEVTCYKADTQEPACLFYRAPPSLSTGTAPARLKILDGVAFIVPGDGCLHVVQPLDSAYLSTQRYCSNVSRQLLLDGAPVVYARARGAAHEADLHLAQAGSFGTAVRVD